MASDSSTSPIGDGTSAGLHPGPDSGLARLDVDALYRSLGHRLEQIVRADVRAPDTVIEDACQFAWSRLVRHAHRVRHECALAWLAQTARREAVKLVRRDGRDISLDAVLEIGVPMGRSTLAPAPDEVCEQHQRLALVDTLPERQQRVLWLHALGLSYAEIAVQTGYSLRTVERQLLRAKRCVRLLEAAPATPSHSRDRSRISDSRHYKSGAPARTE